MNKQLLLYLNIIQTKGNILKLIHNGIRFKDIPNLTAEAIELSYLEYKDDKLVLSDAGKKILETENHLLKDRNHETWIEKEKSSMIPKIEEGFIFLPNQHNLQL